MKMEHAISGTSAATYKVMEPTWFCALLLARAFEPEFRLVPPLISVFKVRPFLKQIVDVIAGFKK